VVYGLAIKSKKYHSLSLKNNMLKKKGVGASHLSMNILEALKIKDLRE